MASLNVKYKHNLYGNYQPQVVIQGKVYYYIGPLEVEEQESPKFAALYVYDRTLQGAARINTLLMQHELSIGNNVVPFVINTTITIKSVTIGDITLPQKYVICTTNANRRQLTFLQ